MTPEQTLIAMCLQYPQTLPHITATVKPDEVTDPICRKVYRQIIQQYDRTKDAHLSNLTLDELVLIEVADWMDGITSHQGHKAVADAVKTNGQREKLRKALLASIDRLEDGETVQGVYDSLMASQRDFGRSMEPPEALYDVLRVELDRPTQETYKTFITSLDAVLEIRPGQLGIIAARPGIGKSSLARQIGLYSGVYRRVLFNSSEMSKEEVSSSLGGLILRTETSRVQCKELTKNERERLIEKSKGVMFDLSEYSSTRDIENAVVSAKHAENEYKVVIVDYLQLLEYHEKTGNRTEAVSGITRHLKKIAMQYKLSMIALSQLSRGAANERPQLHHLRESGSIEQDANWVLFIDNDPDDSRIKRLYLDKNRGGSLGSFSLNWHPEWTGFTDLEGIC